MSLTKTKRWWTRWVSYPNVFRTTISGGSFTCEKESEVGFAGDAQEGLRLCYFFSGLTFDVTMAVTIKQRGPVDQLEARARVKPSRQELYQRASAIIRNARGSTELLMKKGLIKSPPVKPNS